MSIIIKGMDMPSNCAECGVQQESRCGTDYKWLLEHQDYYNARRPDCPLVEIPTPHGRLIDENDLIDHYWYYDADDEEGHFSRNVCEYDIERAPTILEAEE